MPTLDWIGKEAVINHHKEVPFRLLQGDPALSVGEPDGNLLVEGDNLEGLKALLPYYAGQVKCIYIDPPYNTGNENWVYNDNVNSPQIRAWLGKVVGGEGEDLSRHDKWLCMMYPRLKLLWQLLRNDGAIFVSIDYNEEAGLRLLLDEIFGPQHYRNTFVVARVKKSIRERERVKGVNFGHSSVIFYARSPSTVITPPTKPQKKKQRWHAFDAPGIRPNQGYELFGHRPPPNRHWLYLEDRATELKGLGLLRPNPRTGKPQYRLEESEETLLDTNWTDIQEAAFSWNFPYGEKNPALIRRVVQMVCGPRDIILDSFAGSGTTGHAVLQLNKDDGGDRRFIMVELESDIARTITAERLRKVIQGYTRADQRGNDHEEEGLGGGFRYCTLGATMFNRDGAIHQAVTWEDLARHIWFTETRNPWPGRMPQEGGSALETCLGAFNGVAFYLHFNGIGGNVFGPLQLAELPADEAPKVVYADTLAVEPADLDEYSVTFKQIPYDVRVL